jgi:uncharacterized protein
MAAAARRIALRTAPRTAPRAAVLPARRAAVLLAALLALGTLGGCNSLFFQPDRFRYWLPDQFGLKSEDVFFHSGDGTPLTGWFLPAQGPARGTIVFFHGNAANISNHLPLVRWLPAAGYAVFLFDYRGYGVSGGEPSREGLIQDGAAAIAAVRARPDVDPARLVVYGHSLGGAVAVGALARAGTAGVRALVLESSFGSYREEARLLMDAHWFTWPFQYPVAWLTISDDHRPYDDLPALAKVPLLVVASTGDRTVPIAASRGVYDAFPGPDKTFLEVHGRPHGGIFVQDDSPWRAPLLDWLAARLGPPPAHEAASSAAGPSAAGPSAAGPSAAGPSAAGPSAAKP